MCFPNAMCVPKSLVKIFVSIGNVMRKRRVKATMFSSFGVRSHQRRGAPPVAGTGSAIYFVPPNRIFPSVNVSDKFLPVGRFRAGSRESSGDPKDITRRERGSPARPSRRTAAGGIPW